MTLDSPLRPFHSFVMAVDGGHRIHIAEFGSRTGRPVLFLHGGPGSGCNPEHARLFNPDNYRLIQVDQRGCGGSQPRGRLQHNTLQTLVGDLIRLRERLRIARWLVYGGSWGGTLALQYAKREPDRTDALLLRAPFLARQEDLTWFADRQGVARTLPDAFGQLCTTLGIGQDGDTIAQLHRTLCVDDLDLQTAYQAALAWDRWEATVMGVALPANETDLARRTARILRKRIYAHFCHHRFFLGEHGILPDLERLQEIPGTILHGSDDRVCRPAGSLTLKERLPHFRLQMLAGCGHGFESEPMRDAVQNLLDNPGA